MKLLRFGIRFWITVTSVVSFLSGWILLAHAPKPISANTSRPSNVAIPTLEPLQPLSNFQSDDNNVQSAPQFDFQQQNQFRPQFRSGGS